MRNLLTILLVVCTATLLLSCTDWSKENIDTTIEKGNRLIEAVHQYQQNEGRFPAKLSQLKPSYISKIPLPDVGNRKWDYVLERKGFYLGVNGFSEESDPVLYRTNESNEWFMDTR